jgi:hypothetical protein
MAKPCPSCSEVTQYGWAFCSSCGYGLAAVVTRQAPETTTVEIPAFDGEPRKLVETIVPSEPKTLGGHMDHGKFSEVWKFPVHVHEGSSGSSKPCGCEVNPGNMVPMRDTDGLSWYPTPEEPVNPRVARIGVIGVPTVPTSRPKDWSPWDVWYPGRVGLVGA